MRRARKSSSCPPVPNRSLGALACLRHLATIIVDGTNRPPPEVRRPVLTIAPSAGPSGIHMAKDFAIPFQEMFRRLLARSASAGWGATGRNAAWLMADKVVRLGLGATVVLVSARLLGPEDFGRLSFATALAAIVGAVCTLGANPIVVRELVRRPADAPAIVDTTLFMLLASGCMGTLITLVLALWMQREDPVVLAATALIGCTIGFKSADAFRFWFEARMEAKPVVLVDNAVFGAFAVIKVAAVYWSRSVLVLAAILVAESIAAALALATLHKVRSGLASRPRRNAAELAHLLRQCWPMALSAASVMLYMRVDQLMLAQMAGTHELGVYSAALKLSELWYFIPTAISTALLPRLIRMRDADVDEFHRTLSKVMRAMVLSAIAVAVVVTVFRDLIINAVFGASYAQASTVLAIHVWTGVFVCLGVLSGSWYIIEGMQKSALARTIFGAGVNVLLNLALIPRFGAVGAAVATLAAQACATYLFDALTSRTRVLFRLKTWALLPWAPRP